MFGITRDALIVVLKCLEGRASFDECRMAKEFVKDLLHRAEQSDDYIAFVSDFEAEIDVDEIMRHEEVISKLSDIYQLSTDLIEALIDDYFEMMEGGDLI